MATTFADITPQTVAAYLGRELSSLEAENFSLYLQVAVERLDDLLCIDIAGMEDIPSDLQLLIARCFGLLATEQEAAANFGVASKDVEDFSISYHAEMLETTPMVEFVKQNSTIIEKYGECQAEIRSGKVRPYHGDCFPVL